jgi:hypothetical protein
MNEYLYNSLSNDKASNHTDEKLKSYLCAEFPKIFKRDDFRDDLFQLFQNEISLMKADELDSCYGNLYAFYVSLEQIVGLKHYEQTFESIYNIMNEYELSFDETIERIEQAQKENEPQKQSISAKILERIRRLLQK